ncbi:hypothetical protein NGTWS0302_28480 [Mycolicibacterium cyprinidarum]|uniref:Uncharacterized protein n=1 Tax=Mycolicibacterium cyprinidarum TaxID=2860311 RepID=A0ABQ4V9P9_9MYCO|nr:hypothetical protein NGTWS0302_28480 [Mycolicibacterium sp. NGTWS0302]GJF14429.1 hypothetical protein NGTWS1702_16290 [Mycolicibacterium sp. NGTWSNA01]GJF15867.1 hypothetical protein NGTWS1803_01330 [Mycolicibacterium sp. NGTWS1803]
MAPSPRIKIAVISALLAGGALAAAGQAGAQPAPVDPLLPPTPGVAAPAPNQVFTYTPIAEGAAPGPAPAPPPAPGTAPYIPPVENGSFNNTGQMSYLRELWNMRNSNDLFNTLYPSQMDPAMAEAMGVRQMPMLPPGELPPGVVSPEAPPGAPAAPAPAPPPVWPPVGMVPLPTP